MNINLRLNDLEKVRTFNIDRDKIRITQMWFFF